jgi:CheY-like chemotaxis protein
MPARLAKNGGALERLLAFNADVIVSELVMPRMDGFELLRHLKERGDHTHRFR